MNIAAGVPVWCDIPKSAVNAAASASIDMLYLFAMFAVPVLLLMAVLFYFVRPHVSRTTFYFSGIGIYLLTSIAVAFVAQISIPGYFGFLLVPLYAPFFLGMGCLPLGLLLLLFRNNRENVEPYSWAQKGIVILLILLGVGALLFYLSFPIVNNLQANHWETKPVKDSATCLSLGGRDVSEFKAQ